MEATSVVHECQFLSVPIKNPRGNDVNRPFQHPVMPNSPYDDDQVEDDGSISDCESGVSGPNIEETKSSSDGLVELYEGNRLYEIIKRRFFLGLGTSEMLTSISSIRRNCFSSFSGEARARSFLIYAQAIEKKCGGNANLKYAWYGGSKDEIEKIMNHGFGNCVNGTYGRGVYLAPDNLSIDSVTSSVTDEDGLKHLLLCRVIMGKMEQVIPGSQQSHPSSDEFDSGVDNILSPRKYIVWSTHMNTYVLPEYIISFRAHSNPEGVERTRAPVRLPNSPWMPFPALISSLTKYLPRNDIGLIAKYHDEHRVGKITRHELITLVRNIAGDKLLTTVIRAFRNKKERGSKDSSSTSMSRQKSGGD